MSATRPSESSAPGASSHWLTVAAVIALVYALGVIGVGSLGNSLGAGNSLAHWIGRGGSLGVIIGVLLHQNAAQLPDDAPRIDGSRIDGSRTDDGTPASMRRAATSDTAMNPTWSARLAPWTIATGLVAIVCGFALGVIGY